MSLWNKGLKYICYSQLDVAQVSRKSCMQVFACSTQVIINLVYLFEIFKIKSHQSASFRFAWLVLP